MMKRVALLYNPSSGRGRSIRRKGKIEACLKRNGIEYDLFLSKSENHLIELTQKTMRKYPFLVGVGGDTTFNIIAKEIISCRENNNQAPVLGIIATGSANDVATGLGLKSIDLTCQAIASGKAKKIDVCVLRLNNQSKPFFFFGSLSAGLATHVNRNVDNFYKNHTFLARSDFISQNLIGISTIHNFFSRKKFPEEIYLKYDGQEFQRKFRLIVFLNTSFYANGMRLNPNANPFSGLIDCVIINTSSFLNTMNFAWCIFKETHMKRKEVECVKADSYKVFSKTGIDILIDGQIVEDIKSFEISVSPFKLDLLLPG